MFTRMFKKKDTHKNYDALAAQLYRAALTQARTPVFYERYGVPDSFDGRFDLLLVHIFLILHSMMDKDDYEDIAQSLFDETFKDMDQVLREMGIGDMGVPKHMRRMMKAFNGRMHAYQYAIAPQSLEKHKIDGLARKSLKEALLSNLYGTTNATNEHLELMEAYMLYNAENLDITNNGNVTFKINRRKT